MTSVSVVIPTYNSEPFIVRTLDAVLAQSRRPDEVIVVDDCSADRTIEVVQKHALFAAWPNARVIQLKRNSGPGAARNSGWNLASSEFVAFLDADDSWHSSKLECQLAAMERNRWAAFSGHKYIVSATGFANDENVGMPSYREMTLSHFLVKNRFSTPSMMLRTSLAMRFSEDREIAEDYLLQLKLLASGHRALMINAPLVCLHKRAYGDSGLSSELKRMEYKDLRSFSLLRRDGDISVSQFLGASCLSYLKYLRRLIVVRMRQLSMRRNLKSVETSD